MDEQLDEQLNEQQQLADELRRLEDLQEINNLMGRRAYLHSAGHNDRELAECWARHTPGVAFEPEDYGVWDGLEGIKASYVDRNPFPAGVIGLLIEHTLTSGVIEIAADGLTAKGVWISPGHETFPVPGGDPVGHWSWGRYGVDFVKEEDRWKIWHLHVYTTFRTPYDQDWVDSAVNRPPHFPPLGQVMPGMPVADRPVTFNRPYHPDTEPVLQPVPPQPYGTWQETWSYTDPQGEQR
jgi:hypothetical protein